MTKEEAGKMTSYEVNVTHTGRSMGQQGNEDGFNIFDESQKHFGTEKEVSDWLCEQYQTCKALPMYHDAAVNAEGTHLPVGDIYCFKNKDISHDSAWWYQRDWVSVVKVEGSAYSPKGQSRSVVRIKRAE